MAKHRLLLAISLLLAAYALGLSRFLPSGLFFIVAICWVSFGTSVLFVRLEAAKEMAMSMIVILVIAGIICSLIPLGQTDIKALMLLGFFPISIAWAGAYIYIRHLQAVGDESADLLEAWFEEYENEHLVVSEQSKLLGQNFVDEMEHGARRGNDPTTLTTNRRRG